MQFIKSQGNQIGDCWWSITSQKIWRKQSKVCANFEIRIINCQWLYCYILIPITRFKVLSSKKKKKKKHVVVKELSFLPYTFSNFILHTSIQCLFGREFDAIFIVPSKVRIWLSFFLYILKIMKNRQFVRGENTLFFKFRFFQFILRRKHSD